MATKLKKAKTRQLNALVNTALLDQVRDYCLAIGRSQRHFIECALVDLLKKERPGANI